MTALEIIKKEIKRLSSEQLNKVKSYISSMAKTNGKTHNKRKRVKSNRNSYDEYYGIYNYGKRKIESELKQIRTERTRDFELPD